MNTNRQIDIMGIVNLTDDSFFSDSRCTTVEASLDLVARHVAAGADILDIGACSSRPGSLPVGPDEEWRRLEPALEAIRDKFPSARISIDTCWSEIVRKAHDLIGDFIVNDISAGEDDPLMLSTVGRLGLTYIAMHKRGDSMNMQSLTGYSDVTEDVASYFREFSLKAETNGIKDWIIDPGFGFAKTIEQNYELLSGLGQFKEAFGDRRLLVGVSRKSMIYKTLGITPEEALPATQALHMAALSHGADILRVHDVAEAVQVVRLYRKLSENICIKKNNH